MIDRSFDLPLGDPRYGRNHLAPGSIAIEHSYSELASDCLRLDCEVLGPEASPADQRKAANAEVRRLVRQEYGQAALDGFDEHAEPWRANHSSPTWATFLGAAFDQRGLAAVKVYYELGRRREILPSGLRHLARMAKTALPCGLRPALVAIGSNRHRGSKSVYFRPRDDFQLGDLKPMMRRFGIEHQFPSLLATAATLVGPSTTISRHWAMMRLREVDQGFELKLEIGARELPKTAREIQRLIERLLAERPDSQRSLRRWMEAMTPEGYDTPGTISVVSMRVTPRLSARLNVYFCPNGYGLERARITESAVPIGEAESQSAGRSRQPGTDV